MSILDPKTGTYLGSDGRKHGWGGAVRWRATQYIGEGATAVSTWTVCLLWPLWEEQKDTREPSL